MAYRSTEKTRKKKDVKRTAMMQAAIRVFAEKGYHAATVRDVVEAAEVAVGTFYFYFPDKETLFVHLFDETAAFLLKTLQQALAARPGFAQRVEGAAQAYLNVALYEPAVVQLLLVNGPGSVPALAERQADFRQKMVRLWQRPLAEAAERGQLAPQSTRRTAEAIVGALDEVIYNVLISPNPEHEAPAALREIVHFTLRATGYQEPGTVMADTAGLARAV
jgi:TetR/AcrR family fatty acid metabolism transcriptional regulator